MDCDFASSPGLIRFRRLQPGTGLTTRAFQDGRLWRPANHPGGYGGVADASLRRRKQQHGWMCGLTFLPRRESDTQQVAHRAVLAPSDIPRICATDQGQGGAKRPLWNWHQTPDAPHPLMPCIGGQAQIGEVIQRATAGLCGCIPTSQAASDSLPETPTCDSYQSRNKLACCAGLVWQLACSHRTERTWKVAEGAWLQYVAAMLSRFAHPRMCKRDCFESGCGIAENRRKQRKVSPNHFHINGPSQALLFPASASCSHNLRGALTIAALRRNDFSQSR